METREFKFLWLPITSCHTLNHLLHEICKETNEFQKTVRFPQYAPCKEARSMSKINKKQSWHTSFQINSSYSLRIYLKVSITFNIISENIWRIDYFRWGFLVGMDRPAQITQNNKSGKEKVRDEVDFLCNEHHSFL